MDILHVLSETQTTRRWRKRRRNREHI